MGNVDGEAVGVGDLSTLLTKLDVADHPTTQEDHVGGVEFDCALKAAG